MRDSCSRVASAEPVWHMESVPEQSKPPYSYNYLHFIKQKGQHKQRSRRWNSTLILTFQLGALFYWNCDVYFYVALMMLQNKSERVWPLSRRSHGKRLLSHQRFFNTWKETKYVEEQEDGIHWHDYCILPSLHWQNDKFYCCTCLAHLCSRYCVLVGSSWEQAKL